METHTKLLIFLILSCLVCRLVQFRLKQLIFRSSRLLRSSGIGLALAFLCNFWISVTYISSRYLYLHDFNSAVSDMYYMIIFYSYFIPYMIRRVNIVFPHQFQYLNVCSSMMFVHPEGAVGDLHGILKYHLQCRHGVGVNNLLLDVSLSQCRQSCLVTVILHIWLGDRRFIKQLSWLVSPLSAMCSSSGMVWDSRAADNHVYSIYI